MGNPLRVLALVATLVFSACSDHGASQFEDGADYDRYDDPHGTFMGYDCTEDCSGHEAGYNWADDNGISDPDDCGGNSQSFEEGCRAYAEENGY